MILTSLFLEDILFEALPGTFDLSKKKILDIVKILLQRERSWYKDCKHIVVD